jgi:hypothetical protein
MNHPLVKAIAANYALSGAGVEQFLAGFMYNFVEKDNLPEIQKCLVNAGSVETQVMKAVSEFSKGDLQDLIAAATDLAHLVGELPEDLKDCKAMSADVAKIEAWGKAEITPAGLAQIAKNVLANWSAMQADVAKLNTDWSAAKFYQAGLDTSDGFMLALGKINYAEQDKDIDWDLLNDHLTLY